MQLRVSKTDQMVIWKKVSGDQFKATKDVLSPVNAEHAFHRSTQIERLI